MAILRAVRDAGSDLEVNSGGELFKALKIGFKPEQIIFNGTSKTETELEEAINAGIYAIQADSFYEIELIETVARRLNKRANVSLRLVPEIESIFILSKPGYSSISSTIVREILRNNGDISQFIPEEAKEFIQVQ